MTLSLIFILIAVLYTGLIVAFTAGWMRLPIFWYKESSETPFSIIIPARNEQKHIMQLLILLRNQHYPKNRYEVIVVDDHSTDATAAIVERKIASGFFTNVRLIKARDLTTKPGKKNALALGIEMAKNNWIVTLDADVLLWTHWLQSLAGFIEQEQPAMIIGPVAMAPGKTIFSQMQALEFMSLAGSTAGAAAIGRPVMCNGANLAFRKDLFLQVGGYSGNEHLASGDDVFLLHKFKKLPGAKIPYMKSHGAIVYTRAVSTVKEFLRQRGRWAGKTGSYRDAFTLLVGFVVALMNLTIFAGILVSPFISQKALLGALLLLVFKALVDFPLLFSLSDYHRRRDLMWLYPALALVYPFYVVASLFAGFVIKPRWKS
ncbi:MAG: glycosyltransferase [Bacteroides sp.]|jgi:cellulose synthase/poly-beta-1,6-N-acetylglucosamine synthase-like glycosyltransferase|nr:glycosyltransferase [Bacteroides sp.]